MTTINAIYRYPVKGLSPDKLDKIQIEKDEGFAFDRFWAIENGGRDFDRDNLRHIPKGRFLQLANNPKLALLKCRFHEEDKTLAITLKGKQLVCGDMTTPDGVTMIESIITDYMGDELRGKLRLVSATGHHFSDIPQKAVSLINLASVREISKVAGTDVSPLRFRGNIYVDGFEPFAEMDWEGKTIEVDGNPMFEVFAVTGRCPATKVNLDTGERDVEMLDVLNNSFGHTNCGVYMKTLNDGLIKPGRNLSVA